MPHIAIVGAGAAGLASALFLARRGHRVTLIEKDADAPPADVEDCFRHWSRRGLAQARQPHIVLGRSAALLQQEAPDVLAELVAAGVNLFTAGLDRVGLDEDQSGTFVCVRRLVLEAVLRRQVLKEANVGFIAGVEIAGLTAVPGEAVPRVTGVRLADGETIAADLTVDASGRFSPTPQWVSDITGAPVAETFHDCGFCYVTRWFRLKPGEAFPRMRIPLNRLAAYAGFMIFPADGGVYGLSMTLSVRDPLRARLRDPAVFDAIMRAMPEFAPWLDVGEAITEPLMLARIENRARSLLSEGRATVSGLVLLGDSALHTNPTVGRGVTMALLQAQHLAQAVEGADLGGRSFVEALEHWRAEQLGPWFDNQVAGDARRLAAIDRALDGEPPLPPANEMERFAAALPVVAAQNPAVGQKWLRMAHMTLTPGELFTDPEVRAAIERHLADGGGFAPMLGLERERFEALAGG